MSEKVDIERLHLAVSLQQAGNSRAAAEIYRDLAQRDPHNFYALHLLGVIEASSGNLEEAKRLMARSMGVRPPNLQFIQNYAGLHCRLGDYQACHELCEQGLRIQGSDPHLLYLSAHASFQMSRLPEALSRYDAVLSLEPSNLTAMNERARVLAAMGQFETALAGIHRALTLDPRHAEALSSRGDILIGLARFDEAVTAYDAALGSNANYAGAWCGRGNALLGLRRYDESIAAYDKALTLNPGLPGALLGRGNVLLARKRHGEALAAYDKALASEPRAVGAWLGRGNALFELRRHHEAMSAYDKALASKPDLFDAWVGRGNALVELGRHDDAVAAFDKALGLKPDLAGAWQGRGNALFSLERHDDAIDAFSKALAIAPDHPAALHGLGSALFGLKRLEEALVAYDKALILEPGLAAAWCGRGNALMRLARYAEALASYDKALAIFSDAPTINLDVAEIHCNRSWIKLLTGDFDEGWREYEWRLKRKSQGASSRRELMEPRWLGGASLEGKTILLHTEQGLGDTLQYVRYSPIVAAMGAKVVLEVQAPLKPVLAAIDDSTLVVARGERLPPFDCHCPLLSLPLALRTTTETIPARVPYLSASEDRLRRWRERLPASGRPRVAVAWAGNPAFKDDQTRSIGLARLSPLLSVDGIEFFGIQKDLRSGDRDILGANAHVTHLGDMIEDFGDTAAITSLVDLVISSDTSIVHLAGALGRPIWILLQYAADWRWLLGRDDNPWYPTARLFRQPKAGDWESVVQTIRHELTCLWRDRNFVQA